MKRTKKPKGKTETAFKFFLKFIIGMCAIDTYYLSNYLQTESSVNQIRVLNEVLNLTSMTEGYFWYAVNVQREMIND